MTEKQFITTYCHNCGTQRCEGIGTEWFEGCPKRWNLDGYGDAAAEIEQLNKKVMELASKLTLGKIGTLKATTAWVHNIRLECVECTHCGYRWVMETDYDLEFYQEQWSYCPFCGATLVKG